MALTEGDKAICAEITREIVEEVVTNVLKVHLEACPHGKALARSRAIVIGACIGSGLGSGGLVLAIAKIASAI